MSIEENKALARRFHECTLDDYCELMSVDFIGRDNLGHEWDRDFQVSGLKADLDAFTDLHDSIHNIIAEDDLVAVRFTRSGIFSARYEDDHSTFGPTFKEVYFPVMELLRVSEAKVVEGWFYNDDGQAERALLGKDE